MSQARSDFGMASIDSLDSDDVELIGRSNRVPDPLTDDQSSGIANRFKDVSIGHDGRDLFVIGGSDFAQFSSQLDRTVSAAAAVAPLDTHVSLAPPIQAAEIAGHLAPDADLQPYPARISLSTLDGSNGFKFSNTPAGSHTGTAVAAVDINGDGFADLIVGAPLDLSHAGHANGATYVVYGHAGGFAADIVPSDLNGTTGVTFAGATPSDGAGQAVHAIGDINGDGIDDLFIGAPTAYSPGGVGSARGTAYVVFGSASGFGANFNLGNLHGATTGFKLMGYTDSDFVGAVGSGGDVNGDGFSDLIVTARESSRGGYRDGAVYVLYGHAGGFADSLNLANFTSSDGFAIVGGDVSGGGRVEVTDGTSVGDFNGDGFDDVLVHANGETFVVLGKASFSGDFDLAHTNANGTNGDFVITADVSPQPLTAAAAGDVNGDGFADIVLGSPSFSYQSNGSGAAYVVFGHANPTGTDVTTLDGSDGFRIMGEGTPYFGTGYAVSSAGDVNGDGFGDLLVGEVDRTGLFPPHPDNTYVVFGKASGFSPVLDLSSLDGTNGFKLSGVVQGDYAGAAVAAGDINDDGFSDIIVGAPAPHTDPSSPGATYVVFGRLPDAAVNRVGTNASQTLAGGDFNDTFMGLGGNDKLYGNGGLDVAIYSGAVSDYSIVHNPAGGYTITDLRPGSPDGTDVLKGIETAQFTDGARTLADIEPYPAAVSLTTLDGSNGFRIGGGTAGYQVGASISSAGDLNGDGFSDVVIGSAGGQYSLAQPNGPDGLNGAAYVVFGQAADFKPDVNLPSLDGTDGFRIVGFHVGMSVSAAGDVNGDGYADLIVGAERSPTDAAFVLFGKAGGFPAIVDLATLSGTDGFRLSVPSGGFAQGIAVASSDVNGDGFSDLIVGDPGAAGHGNNTGAAFVVFGHGGAFTGNVDLSTLNGTNGFKLGGAGANDFTGGSVAAAGDVNGDGVADIIIGAHSQSGGDRGAAYVVFGHTGGFGATLDVSTLNGTNGFKLVGPADGDLTGESVATAGDINGDGYADIIIGASAAGAPPGSNAGASYVVFGHAGGFPASIDLSTLNGTTGFKLTGGANNDRFGTSVASAGDVNGDGFSDLIVGARGAGAGAGASYVVFGHAGGFASSIDVSTLHGADGFKIGGGTGTLVGAAVSSAGDVNGDGFSDLAIGAGLGPYPSNAGVAYVMYGRLPDAAVTRVGTDASQTLAGGDFNDTFTGLGGNDKIYGNGGSDTAVYRGANTDYAVSYDATTQTYTIADVRAGSPDGTDTDKGIEKFQFSNGTFTFDTSGHTTSQTVVNGDGTTNVAVFDAANTAPWSAEVTTLSVTGSIAAQTIVNDNGTHWTNTYDTTNATAVRWTSDGFDASGHQLTEVGTNDDGSHFLTLFDAANQYAWTSATLTFDANWNQTGLSGTNDDSSHTITMANIAAALDTALWFTTPYDANQGAPVAITLTGGSDIDVLYGFGGADTLNGGGGNDYLSGGAAGDTLTGGTGADTFAYRNVTDSTSSTYDRITDFTAGTDKFDLTTPVTGIDATVASGALSTGTFDTDLSAALSSAHLAAGHAVLFTPDSGGLAAHTFLVVDANGFAGYQAGEDYVFDVTGGTLTGLATSDFI